MATVPSDIRQTKLTREWSLGPVLAEREVDQHTWLMAVRADAGLGASLSLVRRLLGLRLAGYTTIVVDLGVAALMQCRRKMTVCDGVLVVAAQRPDVQRALARAGLELAGEFDEP